MLITSLQNPRIKTIVKLGSRRQRDVDRRTVVEGVKEVARCLDAGIVPLEAYVCPDLAADETGAALVHRLVGMADQRLTQLFEVTPDVFAKIAYRGESGGLLLVIPYLDTPLDNLMTTRNTDHPPFFAVIEGVEKPGNLGAILRTADAAGVDGLIVCPGERGGTDLHNPNVIRASLGTLFTVKVAQAESATVLAWLRSHGITALAATPDGEVPFTQADMTGPVAVAAGSEAFGLTDLWLNGAHQRVTIPMFGMADSLNLATSTALLLYEVVRQRDAKSS
ncbi:MAG: RNA methyltransferase [Caldilineaceae bacterium]|nr:RNA methyltransferase [Caldilineaceae bacterium]MBP8108643.1 RNA methyltransferase [Caldilineaceae bacterium]MBP8123220.1 RNA methyltransferase [Caldilineaceae bacterium]MBP9073275.1 RNA methyltransferase [Caldilineaceae bacterium]